MALSKEERAKRKRKRELIRAKRPSAVDRLAALADSDGPAAKKVALWEEREEWVNSATSFITSFGQEPHAVVDRFIREKLGG